MSVCAYNHVHMMVGHGFPRNQNDIGSELLNNLSQNIENSVSTQVY